MVKAICRDFEPLYAVVALVRIKMKSFTSSFDLQHLIEGEIHIHSTCQELAMLSLAFLRFFLDLFSIILLSC